jgi:hypothetical protein
MSPQQLAIAYQACEVADLAAAAIALDAPADAVAQAELVLAAAQQLVAVVKGEFSTDPLQRFAHEHPAEAEEDIAEWLTRHAFDPSAARDVPRACCGERGRGRAAGAPCADTDRPPWRRW